MQWLLHFESVYSSNNSVIAFVPTLIDINEQISVFIIENNYVSTANNR